MMAALVLAAGRSSRTAPAHKLLEPLGCSTVLGQTLDRLQASVVDAILLVVGHEAARVAACAAGRVQIVHATEHERGLSASLAAGLACLPAAARFVLVVLGDMPLVRTATIDRLVAAGRGSEASIVAPTFGGVRGNPVLWHRTHWPSLARLAGDEGGRSLLRVHPTLLVETNDPGVLFDIDTPASLAEARRTAGS